jgi:ABC-type phosphate transport system substrate-binding protein
VTAVTAEAPRRSTPSSHRLGAAAGLAGSFRRAALLIAAALLLAGGQPVAAAADFVVVVNAANPESALPAANVSKMFLQRITHWTRTPERVMAVDLAEDSPVRASFSRAVHERSTAAVKAYWQKMIFSGRDVPPPEKASAAEVLAYVRANPGAIGYVPAGTALPDGVKALKVTQ